MFCIHDVTVSIRLSSRHFISRLASETPAQMVKGEVLSATTTQLREDHHSSVLPLDARLGWRIEPCGGWTRCFDWWRSERVSPSLQKRFGVDVIERAHFSANVFNHRRNVLPRNRRECEQLGLHLHARVFIHVRMRILSSHIRVERRQVRAHAMLLF